MTPCHIHTVAFSRVKSIQTETVPNTQTSEDDIELSRVTSYQPMKAQRCYLPSLRHRLPQCKCPVPLCICTRCRPILAPTVNLIEA